MTEQTPGWRTSSRPPKTNRRSTSGTPPTCHLWSRTCDGVVPLEREGLLRPGRTGARLPGVDDDRASAAERGPLDRGRAGREASAARELSLGHLRSDPPGRLPAVPSPRGTPPQRADRARPSRRTSVQGRAPDLRTRTTTPTSSSSGPRTARSSPVVPWPLLMRERIHRRAAVERALPLVVARGRARRAAVEQHPLHRFRRGTAERGTGLHTSVPTITWVVTAPMLGLRRHGAVRGKDERPLGSPPLLSDRDRRQHRSWPCFRPGSRRRHPDLRPRPRRCGRGRARSLLDGLVLGVFDRGDRVKAMGWWSIVGAGGPVMGVAIGGPIIEIDRMALRCSCSRWSSGPSPWWLPCCPPRARPPASGAQNEHGQPKERGPPSTSSGAVAVVVAVGGLLFGLNRAPVLGWGSAFVDGRLRPGGASSGVVLVMVEQRATDPLVPVALSGADGTSPSPSARRCSPTSPTWEGSSSPRFCSSRCSVEANRPPASSSSRGPWCSRCAHPSPGTWRCGWVSAPTAVTGTLAVVASMAYSPSPGRGTGVALVEVALVLSGIGMGVASPSIAASVANVVDQDALGTASATQQLATQIAAVSGIQILQTVQDVCGRGALDVSCCVVSHRVRRRGSGGRRSVSCVRARACTDVRRDRWMARARTTGPVPGRAARDVLCVGDRAGASPFLGVGPGRHAPQLISLAMSPSTLILPVMNACMATWELPSTRMDLAVA